MGPESVSRLTRYGSARIILLSDRRHQYQNFRQLMQQSGTAIRRPTNTRNAAQVSTKSERSKLLSEHFSTPNLRRYDPPTGEYRMMHPEAKKVVTTRERRDVIYKFLFKGAGLVGFRRDGVCHDRKRAGSQSGALRNWPERAAGDGPASR